MVWPRNRLVHKVIHRRWGPRFEHGLPRSKVHALNDDYSWNSGLSACFLTSFLLFSDNPANSAVFERKPLEATIRTLNKRPACRSLKSIVMCNPAGASRCIEGVMKRFFMVLAVVASMFLVACASRGDKTAGGQDGLGRITATGYTEEGCLLNLKLIARERNVRLIPDDVQTEATSFIFLVPIVNHEGYRCSASFIERKKRPLSKDPLYPMD